MTTGHRFLLLAVPTFRHYALSSSGLTCALLTYGWDEQISASRPDEWGELANRPACLSCISALTRSKLPAYLPFMLRSALVCAYVLYITGKTKRRRWSKPMAAGTVPVVLRPRAGYRKGSDSDECSLRGHRSRFAVKMKWARLAGFRRLVRCRSRFAAKLTPARLAKPSRTARRERRGLSHRARAGANRLAAERAVASPRQARGGHDMIRHGTTWYRCLWTNALLLCKPLPCSPSAETAIQPLIWSLESWFSHLSSNPDECLFHRRRYDTMQHDTVSFHSFKSQNFKLSVSNPKSKYVAYLSVLSQISNCQSLGPTKTRWHFGNRPYFTDAGMIRCSMIGYSAEGGAVGGGCSRLG